MLSVAAVAAGLGLAGFWLGGYPGAAIVVAATGLFATAFSYRHANRAWLELSRPWVLAGLVLAATLSGMAGEQLQANGATGPLVTLLMSTAPEVICLIAVARLAAALLVGDP